MSLVQYEYQLAGKTYKISIFTALDGQVWFKAKEIAQILNYADTKQAIHKNIRPCDRQLLINLSSNLDIIDVDSGISKTLHPYTIFINQVGLFKFVMRSQKPEAEKFSNWVTSEILPTLFQAGTYSLRADELLETQIKLQETEAELQYIKNELYKTDLKLKIKALELEIKDVKLQTKELELRTKTLQLQTKDHDAKFELEKMRYEKDMELQAKDHENKMKLLKLQIREIQKLTTNP